MPIKCWFSFNSNYKKQTETEKKSSFCRNYWCHWRNHFFSYPLYSKSHIDSG